MPLLSLLSALDQQRTVAPAGYNRWLIPPTALAVDLCIGQVNAASVYKTSLVSHFAVSQTAIGVIFSIAIVMLGLSAAVGGAWVERNGPRKSMFVSACCWGAGFCVGALGIATRQLWLLYLGYGVIGGIGLGIGYISPVATLIRWFPDRPGLATGLAIMGFGGGALVASPAEHQLLSLYDPWFDPGDSASVASGGALVTLFLTLGAAYFLIMMFGVANVRVPPRGWRPHGFDPVRVAATRLVTTADVSTRNAVRSPGGESTVAVSAAAGFVGVLSLFSMAGRFVWSSTSDLAGRKPMYAVYLGGGIVLYTLLATVGKDATPLFVLLAGLILSFYGGGFATAPAYLRDLFGTYQVGAIHGRLLTAWSLAGVAGPLIVNRFLDAQGQPGTLTAAAYRPALLTMVGILAVGFVANLLIRPVADRYHEPAGPAAHPALTWRD